LEPEIPRLPHKSFGVPSARHRTSVPTARRKTGQVFSRRPLGREEEAPWLALGRPLARKAVTLEERREDFVARCEARTLSERTLEWYDAAALVAGLAGRSDA
jgi:hypothetical protein